MNHHRHCTGSGLQPSLRYVREARGKCRVCGGWFALSAGSRLKAHSHKVQQLHLSTRAAA